MEIVNRVSRMSAITAKVLSTDVKIGLVSTMGAIHPGHLSLIQMARKMTDLVVVSIFVNRLQFLTDEEYQKYPRDITKDVDLLRHESVDYIFTPPEEEMYPPDFSTYVEVENFGQKLPGLHRAAYFKGMTTSVVKMIQIVKPAFIFFGQKDGLQGAILRKMIRDLNINTEVVVTPIVRDTSGLAYAARNYFLTEPQKIAASVIFRSLRGAEAAIVAGEAQVKKVIAEIERVVATEPLAKLEYAVVADPVTLEPLTKIQGSALIAVGAMIGNTSLNDSLLIEKR
ncbi:MAG TPA: pantoate--beta-alanine ligase [Acidobacteriota bacterium]|nr:pantoate--beta-alanine ligase [Acidobacteriota bacterium]